MKNIILIAPPAAGKGTQSKMICEKYNLVHISTGDILREKSKTNVELADLMKKGCLIDDNTMTKLVSERLKEDDCKNGFILDGFPRNINQAQLLSDMNININYVFYLNVDEEILKKRIVGRISCPNCGSVYNEQIDESMPQKTNICDKCGNNLIKREDDNEESFKTRYETYILNTFPLIDFYRNNSNLYEINSTDKMTTFNEICKVLNGEI